MKTYLTWTMLLCALVALEGCGSTGSASSIDGSGFSTLHPSSATKTFIVANDKPFAREVSAHNQTCQKLPACGK